RKPRWARRKSRPVYQLLTLSRSGGGVGLQKTQDLLIEVARHHLGEAVAALGKDLHLGARNKTCQLLGEIVRGDDVVLRTDDQRGRGNAGELGGAVEGQDGVDAADDDLGRREGREVL